MTMTRTIQKTSRGFERIDFEDCYGESCSFQQSSAIGEYDDSLKNPGSSYVWLGMSEHRMHLNREQARELSGFLARWADTGTFFGGSDE